MRTPLLLLALTSLALASPLAAAQRSSALMIAISSPSEELERDTPGSVVGMVTFVSDLTAATSVNGIPVTYSVSQAPAWATVVVSPSSDVFPAPMFPQLGASYSATRSFTVTIIPDADAPGGAVEAVEITATTTPGPFGKSAVGKGSFVIKIASPEAIQCPEHDPIVASESAMAPSVERPSDASAEESEVTVQQTGARPVSTPWIVVAAFGLVGAGVGIVLRQRTKV